MAVLSSRWYPRSRRHTESVRKSSSMLASMRPCPVDQFLLTPLSSLTPVRCRWCNRVAVSQPVPRHDRVQRAHSVDVHLLNPVSSEARRICLVPQQETICLPTCAVSGRDQNQQFRVSNSPSNASGSHMSWNDGPTPSVTQNMIASATIPRVARA